MLKQNRLETLFYLMVVFALLGPSFSIPIQANFTLTLFRIFFVLLGFSLFVRWVREREWRISYTHSIQWVARFFLFWFIYGVISLTWAVSLSSGIRYLIFLGMMCLLTLSFPTFVKTDQQYGKLMRILFDVFTFIVFVGVFESITLLHLPSSRAFGTSSADVTSVFTNQNDLGTCITLAFPFLIAGLIMLKVERKYQWMLYFVAVYAIYVLLATGSRSNVLFALPVSMIVLVLALAYAVDKSTWSKKFWVKSTFALVAGILIIMLMSSLFLSNIAREVTRSKLANVFGLFQDIRKTPWQLDAGGFEVIRGSTGESVTVRKFLIINGLKFLHKSYYFGVGAGNIQSWMKGAPKVNKVDMHNWWIEVLVNFGVLVFALYLFFYLWILYRLWKLVQPKKTPSLHPWLRWGAVSSLASLLGYVLGAISPSTAIHFTPMWISIGVALAIIQRSEREQTERIDLKK
jgi:teichuronic acid biosynthesis protein TuaE